MVIITIFFMYFLFATTTIINKMLLQEIPIMLFLSIRMFFGGIILIGILAKHQSIKRILHIPKYDLPIILFAALFTNFFPTLLKAFGIKYLPVSEIALFTLGQLFFTFFGYIFFKEKLTTNKIISKMTIVTCMMFISPGISLHTNLTSLHIMSLIAMAGHIALSSLGWTVTQWILKKREYQPINLNALLMLIASICGWATVPFIQQTTSLSFTNPLKTFLLLLYTIIVDNIIARSLYAFFLKKYSTYFVSLTGIFGPFCLLIFGHLFFNEPISVHCIITGIAIFMIVVYGHKSHA